MSDEKVIFGIDIGKRKNCGQLVRITGEVVGKPFWFGATEEEFQRLHGHLIHTGCHVVGHESTSTYGKRLNLYLAEQDRIVYEHNSLITSHQERTRVRKTKTDPTNAEDIAEVTRKRFIEGKLPFEEDDDLQVAKYFAREAGKHKEAARAIKQRIKQYLAIANPGLEEAVSLWTKTGLALLKKWPTLDRLEGAGLDQLTAFIRKRSRGQWKREKAVEILEACRRYWVPKRQAYKLGMLIKNLAIELEMIEERVAQFDKQVIQLTPAEDVELARSVIGVGEETAPALIAEIGPSRNFTRYGQMEAFVGLDPSTRESSDHVGPSHISKRGSPHARRLLHMPTMSATLHNPVVRLRYLELLLGGREPAEAIAICARKLVSILSSVLRNRKPFAVPEWVERRLPEVEQRYLEAEKEGRIKRKKRTHRVVRGRLRV